MIYRQSKSGSYVDLIRFSGGFVQNVSGTSALNYQPRYYSTDYLGSVRCIVDQNGKVVEVNDYTAYGARWDAANRPRSSNRYLFNGKEELACGLLDYGFRLYDPSTGRWVTPDPLAGNYVSVSPYAYCLNNPVNAIDPDGRMVIFINGMSFDGTGGTVAYWAGFDRAVMEHLSDNNARYYDGSLGGHRRFFARMAFGMIPDNLLPWNRYDAGYEAGKRDFATILAMLSDGEKIKVITHSMGAAYAKGFIQALLDMGVDPDLFAFESDFAPYQPQFQKAVKGIPTFQFSHSKDGVASSTPIIGAHVIDTSDDEDQGHPIMEFWNQIRSLPTGKYSFVGGKLIKVETKL